MAAEMGRRLAEGDKKLGEMKKMMEDAAGTASKRVKALEAEIAKLKKSAAEDVSSAEEKARAFLDARGERWGLARGNQLHARIVNQGFGFWGSSSSLRWCWFMC